MSKKPNEMPTAANNWLAPEPTGEVLLPSQMTEPPEDVRPTTSIEVQAPQSTAIEVLPQIGGNPASLSGWLNPVLYNQLGRVANVLAKSNLVPKEYQGKAENCFIAVQMAHRMQIDPLMMIQNLAVIGGRPSISASLSAALAKQAGVFKGPVRHEIKKEGTNIEVTALATLPTGETVKKSVDLKMAEAEGWTRNPKYKSMPEHMLTIRSTTWLIRAYAPEVLFGLYTRDELEDVKAASGK